MDDNQKPAAEIDTSLDRFEHEIEELEGPMENRKTQWILGILLSLALIAGFVLVGQLNR